MIYRPRLCLNGKSERRSGKSVILAWLQVIISQGRWRARETFCFSHIFLSEVMVFSSYFPWHSEYTFLEDTRSVNSIWIMM